MQHESIPAGSAVNPPTPIPDSAAAMKWMAMEHRLGHPLLQSLRGVRKGTLRVYLPDSSEVFYLGADPGAHANLKFSDWGTLDRVAQGGDAALGVDYAAGLWQTTDLRKLMRFAADNGGAFDGAAAPPSRFKRIARAIGGPRPKLRPVFRDDNEFQRLWLDETMTNSAALFHGDARVPLEEAQRAKHRRVLGRLDPQQGEHILDLGCGWGGFMEEAARRGIRVTGISANAAQAAFAQERLSGFAPLTEVKLEDFRRLQGRFDYIVSLEILETLGETAWPEFMNTMFRNLAPGGRAVIQTAVIRDDLFEAYRAGNDFAREHIVPGSLVPSHLRLERAARRAGLQVNDIFHFGRDQAMTLDCWRGRLEAAVPGPGAPGHDEAFVRKWRYHFAQRAAEFESRRMDMIQLELVRPRH